MKNFHAPIFVLIVSLLTTSGYGQQVGSNDRDNPVDTITVGLQKEGNFIEDLARENKRIDSINNDLTQQINSLQNTISDKEKKNYYFNYQTILFVTLNSNESLGRINNLGERIRDARFYLSLVDLQNPSNSSLGGSFLGVVNQKARTIIDNALSSAD